MTMANLIKRIAISTSRKTGKVSIAEEFKSSSNMSTTGQKSGNTKTQKSQRGSLHELSSFVSYTAEGKGSDRVISFAPLGNQIKRTQETVIKSEPNPFYEHRDSENEVAGSFGDGKPQGIMVEERNLSRSKSLDSITEGNESLKSSEVKKGEDSDDEAVLVRKHGIWGRRPT